MEAFGSLRLPAMKRVVPRSMRVRLGLRLALRHEWPARRQAQAAIALVTCTNGSLWWFLSGSALAAPTKLPSFPRRRGIQTEAAAKARHEVSVGNEPAKQSETCHRAPRHRAFTYASNTVGNSANDTVRQCDASLSLPLVRQRLPQLTTQRHRAIHAVDAEQQHTCG